MNYHFLGTRKLNGKFSLCVIGSSASHGWLLAFPGQSFIWSVLCPRTQVRRGWQVKVGIALGKHFFLGTIKITFVAARTHGFYITPTYATLLYTHRHDSKRPNPQMALPPSQDEDAAQIVSHHGSQGFRTQVDAFL